MNWFLWSFLDGWDVPEGRNDEKLISFCWRSRFFYGFWMIFQNYSALRDRTYCDWCFHLNWYRMVVQWSSFILCEMTERFHPMCRQPQWKCRTAFPCIQLHCYHCACLAVRALMAFFMREKYEVCVYICTGMKTDTQENHFCRPGNGSPSTTNAVLLVVFVVIRFSIP